MKKLLFIIFILLSSMIFSHKSEAAIARDQAVSQTGCTGCTSVTFAHINTSTTTNLILFVGASVDSFRTVTGVTYAGTSMTQISTVTTDGNYRQYLFYLNAPATGSNNVVITSGTSGEVLGVTASYTGVNQNVIYTGGSPTDNQITNSNDTSPITTSVTTIADNSWTIVMAMFPAGTLYAGTGSTCFTPACAGSRAILDNKDNGAITPAGSYSMSVTGAGTGHTIDMASFSPFVAAVAQPTGAQIIIFE